MTQELDKEISGVYLIQCTENGKNYIGSAKDIRKRWSQHKQKLREKTHHSMKLQEDWLKYGEDAFDFKVIVECTHADAKKIEQEYIDKFNSEKFGYNTLSYKDNMSKRDKLQCDTLREYIDKTYEDDGNIYCYNPFVLSKAMNLRMTDFLKFLGINRTDKFNVFRDLDNERMIGLNWDNDNVFVQVFNLNTCDLGNVEYIYVN